MEDHPDNILMVCTKLISSDTQEPSQLQYIRSPITNNLSFGIPPDRWRMKTNSVPIFYTYE